jgi:hypothetical protein
LRKHEEIMRCGGEDIVRSQVARRRILYTDEQHAWQKDRGEGTLRKVSNGIKVWFSEYEAYREGRVSSRDAD